MQTMQPMGGDDWTLGFRTLETEVSGRACPVEGDVPAEIAGTLHRIGPGRHDVYGARNRHWFDGDGMVHALRIEDGRVTYANRFVATAGKAVEDAAQRRIYAGFGTRRSGSVLSRFLHRNEHKNPANTNVLTFGGKLYALCEGGRPHRLDPDTLATMGEDDLGGVLAASDLYSAHPKVDPFTGELWNFGASYGKELGLSLYCTKADGTTRRVTTVKCPFLAMVHDFAITATKAIFILAPCALPRLPLGIMLGQRAFGESLRYTPELGAHIAVVDRASGEVRWFAGDPFMFFHTVNAWDDGADTVLDLCAYADGSVLRSFVEVMAGVTPTLARAWPERIVLKKDGTMKRTRLSAVSLEFPRVDERDPFRPAKVAYGVTWPESSSFLSTPAAIDLETGHAELAPLSAGEFAGELVPVPKRGGTGERDVWLLTLVLDATKRQSELRVYDGANISALPVAKARLPHVVPFGFHGNFTPSAPLLS